MCRQDPRAHLSAEEQIAAEESLSIYCKPVELYNILQRRAVRNVSFLPCFCLFFLPLTFSIYIYLIILICSIWLKDLVLFLEGQYNNNFSYMCHTGCVHVGKSTFYINIFC